MTDENANDDRDLKTELDKVDEEKIKAIEDQQDTLDDLSTSYQTGKERGIYAYLKEIDSKSLFFYIVVIIVIYILLSFLNYKQCSECRW